MIKVLVSIIAGLLAGVATGFAGLSAAVFISPMLVGFLGFDSFSAIGIALASDVLASFISAMTYKKNKNIDLPRAKYLFIFVIIFAVLGTILSFIFTANETNNTIMSYWLIISSMLLGLKLLLKPGSDKKNNGQKMPYSYNLISIVSGSYIGFVCGFQGTGGGLMMLFVLNVLLGFEFKKAVGTSVSIMALCAFIGAISHFVMAKGIEDIGVLIICVISTLVGAKVAASLANKMDAILVKRITGFLIVISGIAVLLAGRI